MPEYLSLNQNYLDNLAKTTRQRGFNRFPIVDCDSHYLQTPWLEVAQYVDEPWRRRIEQGWIEQPHTFIPRDQGDRTLDGRMKSYGMYKQLNKPADNPLPPEIYPIVDFNQKAGIDYTIQFPTDLLTAGVHPNPDWEVHLAIGYARWLSDQVLNRSNTIKALLYLPLGDPDASVQLVRDYADKPGILGFMVTTIRRRPLHDPAYLPLFELLEQKGLPLSFHTASFWQEAPFTLLNRFFSAHALGFPFFNMLQLANIITNGIPERFPKLKLIFIEAGLSWLPFMCMRLDAEFLNRQSDVPLLRHKPSHYIKQCYFTTQPMEAPEDPKQLEMCMRMVGTSQLLYASDYPHQDFDPPASIYDLPFLSEQEKRDILGDNAVRLFGEHLTRGNQPGRDW